MMHRIKNVVLGIGVEITFALLVIAIGYLVGSVIYMIF